MRIIWHEEAKDRDREDRDRDREGRGRSGRRVRRLLLRVLLAVVLAIIAIYAYFFFYQPPEEYEQKWVMPNYDGLGEQIESVPAEERMLING